MSTAEGGGDIVRDGLVLYLDATNTRSYPRTGTVWADLSRGGNTGRLENFSSPAPQTIFDPANGGSIIFDGTNDYVNLPTITNNIYTIDFWYKMGGNDGTYGYFASSGDNGFAIGEGGSGIVYGQFYYWNGSLNIFSVIPSITNWNHICVIINTTTNNLQLFGNSIQLNNTTISNMSTSISNIGRYITSNTHYLKGNLASYKIYNRDLSTTEILQNYNATRSRFGI